MNTNLMVVSSYVDDIGAEIQLKSFKLKVLHPPELKEVLADYDTVPAHHLYLPRLYSCCSAVNCLYNSQMQ